jgi:hypothetical protein
MQPQCKRKKNPPDEPAGGFLADCVERDVDRSLDVDLFEGFGHQDFDEFYILIAVHLSFYTYRPP